MRYLLLLFMLSATSLWACSDEIEKLPGETVYFCWDDPPEPGVKLYLYRKTGPATSATLVTTLFKDDYAYKIPAGTMTELRFYVIPIVMQPDGKGKYGPASNEVLVRRKK